MSHVFSDIPFMVIAPRSAGSGAEPARGIRTGDTLWMIEAVTMESGKPGGKLRVNPGILVPAFSCTCPEYLIMELNINNHSSPKTILLEYRPDHILSFLLDRDIEPFSSCSFNKDR